MTRAPFEPNRVRLGGTFLGFAMQELGDRVGVTRQAIHQLEAGHRPPTDDMVGAVAGVLLVEADFFFSGSAPDVSQADCNFRKLESTSVRDMEQVIAHGMLLTELIRYLEQELQFPEPNFPRHNVSELNEIEHVTERVRAHWKLTEDQAVVSTIRVAEHAAAGVGQVPAVPAQI